MSEQQHNSVSLGCGTLILIAIIVSIFSNSKSEIGHDVRQLRNDVQQLTEEVRDLKQLLQADKFGQAESED